MALPGGGEIWLSQLVAEFGNWGPPNWLSHYYRGNLTTANNTGVPASDYISLAHFHGTQKVNPGSTNYTTVGTYSFVVPAYTSLTVQVWGAGGAGGNDYVVGGKGGDGSQSRFGSVIGNGGIGGGATSGGAGGFVRQTPGGAGGTASGGSTNTTGGAGVSGSVGANGRGGHCPNGGNGGGSGTAGGFPGGGGGGWAGNPQADNMGGGGGGAGGYSTRTYSVGQLAVGSTVTVVVGAGGTGVSYGGVPGAGARGRVNIAWN